MIGSERNMFLEWMIWRYPICLVGGLEHVLLRFTGFTIMVGIIIIPFFMVGVPFFVVGMTGSL